MDLDAKPNNKKTIFVRDDRADASYMIYINPNSPYQHLPAFKKAISLKIQDESMRNKAFVLYRMIDNAGTKVKAVITDDDDFKFQVSQAPDGTQLIIQFDDETQTSKQTANIKSHTNSIKHKTSIEEEYYKYKQIIESTPNDDEKKMPKNVVTNYSLVLIILIKPKSLIMRH